MIGTPSGIDEFSKYLERARRPIEPGRNARDKHYDSLAFPDFPGIGSNLSFRTEFISDSTLQRTIPEEYFNNAIKPADTSAKLRGVVELVSRELQVLAEKEPGPNVVVIVLPPSVERECGTVGAAFRGLKVKLTPARKLVQKLEHERAKTGQEMLPFVFVDGPEQESHGFWNIHHALKAYAMRIGLPTQLMWEPRLRGEGLTQDPASMAWNLFTALYYKAGNIPWQSESISPGTCFVGISFYREGPQQDAAMQSSLAQVFSGVGEGMVLKGERAFVDKTRGDRKAHLDARGAKQLLTRAIALYEQHHGGKPIRVVVHKTSRYWPEELQGLRDALGDIQRSDFLALERLDLRFMRLGHEPPIRGTIITLEPRHYLLFTVGYVPFLGLYPGMRVPAPLEIVEHHGTSSAMDVCREIMTLTKVNWNSCAFASREPITIQFARTVGRILTEVREQVAPQSKYRFYM